MVTTLIITRAVPHRRVDFDHGNLYLRSHYAWLDRTVRKRRFARNQAAPIPPGCLEYDRGASFRCPLVLARSREYEWVAAHEHFVGVSVVDGFA